jgi:hypothetical protein
MMRTTRRLIGIAAIGLGLTLAGGVSGAPKQSTGTLELNVRFAVTYESMECQPARPQAECFRFVGKAVVPGLGSVTETYDKVRATVGGKDCVSQIATTVLGIAGKGELFVSAVDPDPCGPPAPASTGPYTLTITDGSGRYAGASGSAEFRSSVGLRGRAVDTWSGRLTVPGLEFDVAPPVLRGAVSKTVRIPKKAKRVRVRYSVTAADAVDGAVAATCLPRSGSFFALGRTRVTCSATDSSGNDGEARFTVTVRRR